MRELPEQVIVAPRFRGPPTSGNGGYVGGLLARRMTAPAAVTFRLPTPLGRALTIVPAPEGGLTLQDGVAVVVEARPAELELTVPPAPALDVCEAASASGGSFAGSEFSGCFSCGRQHPNGLGVFAGAVPGSDLVASVWVPSPDLADSRGHVAVEYIWSALDCSGAIALSQGQSPKSMLTGRMTGAVDADLAPGLPYRVIGWPIGGAGRKWFSGTAIVDPDGRVRGKIMATWIVLREPKGAAD